MTTLQNKILDELRDHFTEVEALLNSRIRIMKEKYPELNIQYDLERIGYQKYIIRRAIDLSELDKAAERITNNTKS